MIHILLVKYLSLLKEQLYITHLLYFYFTIRMWPGLIVIKYTCIFLRVNNMKAIAAIDKPILSTV
jgi:hypothetical protein